MNTRLYSFALVLFLAEILTTGLVNSKENKDNDNILEWDAPLELKKNFAYFLSGLDKEGSPVWVAEYGKWNIRDMLERGGKTAEYFDRYTEQMWARFHKSAQKYQPDNPDGYVAIIDLEGYNSYQATSIPAVQKTLNIVRQATMQGRSKGRTCKAVYLINSNFLFQTVFNLIKPVLGEFASIVELYGTNPDKWRNVLRKEIAQDQLPEWLGGSPNHKPIEVHG